MKERSGPVLPRVHRWYPRYQCNMVNEPSIREIKPTDSFVDKQHLRKNVSDIKHGGKNNERNLLCSESKSRMCSRTINSWSFFSCIRNSGENPWIHVNQRISVNVPKHPLEHLDPVVIVCNGYLGLQILPVAKVSIWNGFDIKRTYLLQQDTIDHIQRVLGLKHSWLSYIQ